MIAIVKSVVTIHSRFIILLHSFHFHGSIILGSEGRNEKKGNDKGMSISLWFYTLLKTAHDLIGITLEVDTLILFGESFLSVVFQ
jgi:hypothetical protein